MSVFLTSRRRNSLIWHFFKDDVRIVIEREFMVTTVLKYL